ncbi:MAG: hypothetical protein EXX96DRAFT_572683 [Benjaminiella poitrasii]|nr:MAG: hypothetical protein EXX96DRAFT_572683 [Benjaminiella poitrasii]
MSKTVRFNPVNTINLTYSADEYDRSCFFYTTTANCTFRPALSQTKLISKTVTSIASNMTRPAIKPLDLSSIICSKENKVKVNKKRPKLTINTQSLTPLFFTQLSTHYKCKEEDDDEECGEEYLIPVMAY